MTLASALWVSVSVPNLPLLRGLDDRGGASVAISLQSALLGIDDRNGGGLDTPALARRLGLSDNVARLLTPVALREGAFRTALVPVTAQLEQSLAVEAARAVQPPDMPRDVAEATSPSESFTGATQPKDAPAAGTPDSGAPTAPPAHPKSGGAAAPVPPPPSQPPSPPPSPPPAQHQPPAPAGDEAPPAAAPAAAPVAETSSPEPGPPPPVQAAPAGPAPDAAPPVIQVHADLSAGAGGPGGVNVSYTPPPATDAVDGAVAVTCLPSSGSVFAIGRTTVTCTATDSAHNTAHSSFAVLVQDAIAPVIQSHGDVVAEAGGPSGAIVTYTAPTASDSIDGAVPVSCAPASGSMFALGHTTVTCSAHDAAGNTTTPETFDVLVDDTTGPAIQARADLVVEATGSAGATVSYTAPTASDAVDGSVSVTCAPASGTVFAIGDATVTCTAQDAGGNVAHSSFGVDVRDTTAPVIQVPDGMTVQATSSAGAPVSFTVTATDAVDGTDPVTCSPASGTTFPAGHTIVTCTAQDAAGNQATSQTIDIYVAAVPSHYDAVLSLFDVAQVIDGFGLSHAVKTALYDQLIATANAVFADDAVATCQAFDGFAVYASSHLTSGQFAQLTPSIDAARTTLGC